MAEQDGANAKTTRADAVRSERRRRRGGQDNSALAVPVDVAAKLAKDGLEGRWINDLGNRMHDKTVNDDWDKVPGIEPVVVGTDRRSGEKIMAHYCAKPSRFLEEDRAARMETIAAHERAIVRGQDKSDLDEGSYQPNTRNRIGNTLS